MFLVMVGINPVKYSYSWLPQQRVNDRANYKTVHVLVPGHRSNILLLFSGRRFCEIPVVLFVNRICFDGYTLNVYLYDIRAGAS